jgi:hypothetical protein
MRGSKSSVDTTLSFDYQKPSQVSIVFQEMLKRISNSVGQYSLTPDALKAGPILTPLTFSNLSKKGFQS